jgi:hypothetical protein
MGNFWDTWATRHRNWRAIFVAAVFLSTLAWGSYKLLSVGELIEKYEDTAVVLNVETYRLSLASTAGGTGSRDTIYRGCVQLSDSVTVEMTLVPPIPAVGDQLPVIVERYDDGSSYYSIDVVKWQTEGPQ